MPVPCAVLKAPLLRSAVGLLVSSPFLGVLLPISFRPLLLLGVLLPTSFRPLLLLGMLRPRVLLLGLGLPLSLPLFGLGLPVLALLLSVLWPWLLLGVLRLFIRFRPRLSMLLCGLRLLVLGFCLFGTVLFLVPLLVLRIGRTRDSEKHKQHDRAGNPNYFHRLSSSNLNAALRNLVFRARSVFKWSKPFREKSKKREPDRTGVAAERWNGPSHPETERSAAGPDQEKLGASSRNRLALVRVNLDALQAGANRPYKLKLSARLTPGYAGLHR